ncbi:MAG TPA: DUF4118 domain-containing protein [Streptosporangiaceae bacterium]|jgi:two-component system sensor histidine kinase KdpD
MSETPAAHRAGADSHDQLRVDAASFEAEFGSQPWVPEPWEERARRTRPRGLAAPLALPAGFAALLAVGALAAAADGAVSVGWVLGLAAVVVLIGAAISEIPAALVLAGVGWFTVAGFSRQPYAQLRFAGPAGWPAALVIGGAAVAGLTCGVVLRRLASSVTLFMVDVSGQPQPEPWPEPGNPGEPGGDPAARLGDGQAGHAGHSPLPGPAQAGHVDPEPAQAAGTPPDSAGLGIPQAAGAYLAAGATPAAASPPLAAGLPGPAAGAPAASLAAGQPWRRRLPDLSGGIGLRRMLSGILLLAGLPLLTFVLSVTGMHPLGDDLLVYLVAVVAIAVVGGFWPAVLGAITASMLVNWYFTPPVHTLSIADGQSLLALMLFVTVAVAVSSVVHLAAHRARQAAHAAGEAQELLALAQTVLGGADSPTAVLDHLTSGYGGHAELLEHSGSQWVKVAGSSRALAASSDSAEPGTRRAAGPELRVAARTGLMLAAGGQARPMTQRLLHGFAAQAAAALDRDRLRTQAALAEALAEGNRMRTALLAAVSHDLRTPLASIKASVSTLRQTDVTWTPEDEAALLATIDQSSDRLDALIGNLLDMSRLTAGSLEPFLRPTAVDEVAPVALRGIDAGGRMRLTVPDDLPLVRTDPGLLERVLANLFANALAYSPVGSDPELRASQDGDSVLLDIIDHGRGVPDTLKQQMFEPFQRLDARAGGPGMVGGIGLGLSVVKGFLDIMGGSVAPADTPGGGLTMRVRLPAAAESPAPLSAQP